MSAWEYLGAVKMANFMNDLGMITTKQAIEAIAELNKIEQSGEANAV